MNGYGGNRIIIFQPMSLFYLIFLLFISSFLLPYLVMTGFIFGYALEIPPYLVFIIFYSPFSGAASIFQLKRLNPSSQSLISERYTSLG